MSNTKKLQTLGTGSLDIAFAVPYQLSYTNSDDTVVDGAAFLNNSNNPIVELKSDKWVYSNDDKIIFSSDNKLVTGA